MLDFRNFARVLLTILTVIRGSICFVEAADHSQRMEMPGDDFDDHQQVLDYALRKVHNAERRGQGGRSQLDPSEMARFIHSLEKSGQRPRFQKSTDRTADELEQVKQKFAQTSSPQEAATRNLEDKSRESPPSLNPPHHEL